MDDEPTIASRPPDSARGDESASLAPTQALTAATAPPPPLEVGSSFGHYKVLRLLGSGGMGAVYEVEDTANGRRVALKVLIGARASASDRQRFLREGRLAAQISHPNTVYIYGTEEIEDHPVITMERMSGGTLQDCMQREGPLPVADAVEATLQIIDGLEAAASLGILHRDIKPSNCFVGEGSTVKVGDFGLSVSTESIGNTQLTATGTILGTPTYASPEQLQGRQLDLRSDIYAVGATLFYLLTGEAPFEGTNLVTLIAAILQETPPSPRDRRPEIPPRLARVIVRCLGKEPSERFATYRDLAGALFPFSKRAHVPAPLVRRFTAYLLDLAILGLPALILGIIQGAGSSGRLDLPVNLVILADAVSMVIGFTYLWLLEGLRGATVGKLAVGLRVVGRGGGAPGLRRVLGRVAFFHLGLATVEIIRDVWLLTVGGRSTDPLILGINSLAIVWLIGLFAVARAANGFQALHDRVSGTRVVHKVSYQGQEVAEAPWERQEPELGDAVGSFRFLAAETVSSDGIRVGWDPALRRHVRNRMASADAPPTTSARQDSDRPGRLRWLDGRRSGTEGWDAFGRPDGSALLTLVESRQPWRRVRRWLVDVAEEIAAAQGDGSLPETVGLEHLWVTADDRVKVTEFAVGPASGSSSASTSSASKPALADGQALLSRVAFVALAGRTASPTGETEVPSVALPLQARQFLTRLAAQAHSGWPELLAELHELARARDAVSRKTWVLYVAVLSIPAILMFLLMGGVALGKGVALERIIGLVLASTALALGFQATVAVTLALITRGGLMLTAFGLTVVRRDGAPASRLRCLLRSAIAWSPAFAVMLGVALVVLQKPPNPEPDIPPVLTTSREGSPMFGPAEAQVTLDIYLDYQDAASSSLWASLEPLLDEFPEDLRIVIRQVPLSGDLPAKAALEAHAQGSFREMHPRLLGLPEGVDSEAVLELGREIELDMGRFEDHLVGELYDPIIERDTREFIDSGVSDLPLVLVNGRRHSLSLDQAKMSERVSEELRWLDGGSRPTEFSAVYRFAKLYGYAIGRSERLLRFLAPPALLALILGIGWLLWKGRGIQDLLAGTHVVPR